MKGGINDIGDSPQKNYTKSIILPSLTMDKFSDDW